MLYSDLDSAECSRRLKTEATIAISLIVAGIAFLVAGLVVRSKLIATAGIIVFAAIAYFWFDNKVVPWQKYKRYLSDVAVGRAHEAAGRVIDVCESVRKSEEGVDIRDFYLKTDDDDEGTLFYWDNAKTLPDVAGKEVRITAYGRYIIGMEIN
ncbi:MAG: hypothetical protein Q4D04_13995 [Clostridia bacterium]|nr:hypothetical protein [Clostridia bacterium]